MIMKMSKLKKKIPKILITGNSGYIGSHLSKILKDDYSIFGLDRKSTRLNSSHVSESRMPSSA